MKNKYLSFLRVAVISLTLAACSAQESSNEASIAAEEAAKAADEALAAADVATQKSSADWAQEAADKAIASANATAAAAVAEIEAEQATTKAPSVSIGGGEMGSHQYCAQLANIGKNTFGTKQEGHSMQTVLGVVTSGLSHDPQRQVAAQGVVLAVYGDDSITSSSEAYDIVYAACKR